MTYQTPIQDISHTLKAIAEIGGLIDKGIVGDLDEDVVAAIVEEAGKFANEQMAPLNHMGDVVGSKLIDGKVVLPEGWDEVYRQWVDAGWGSLPGPEEYGGQGLPLTLSMAVSEIWQAACTAFSLNPMLTQGAAEALALRGSDELKNTYLPKLVSGEWSGTMQLTEPQSGSDLRFLKTKAVPQDDGSYLLSGTKIFITYGEHDLTDNIIHMVLARTPDAPQGTKGISLFLVPKYLVGDDGQLGERNDVHCASLEHKLGIHASPTCVMQMGDEGGAKGWLIGEENQGLNYMFIMMNRARLGVGIQGVGIAERALQQAIDYAHERKQGATADTPPGQMAEIIEHPDVRRMLLSMKAKTAAARAICYVTARAIDIAERSDDEEERARSLATASLLTPVAKAFSTDLGVEVASDGVQVHGGMGYIEETGAAQHFRDARIAPIYEGTNGIQAMDLVMRKLPLEGGGTIQRHISELKEIVSEVKGTNEPAFGATGVRLEEAIGAFEAASAWLLQTMQTNQNAALAGATPYTRLFGITTGAAYLAKGALAERRSGNGSGNGFTAIARYFAEYHSVEAPGLARAIMGGAESILDKDSGALAV